VTCKPALFNTLQIDSGLGHFSHYTSIIQRLDDFETIASQPGGRVTLGIEDPNIIVGYCVGSYPASTDRWAALGDLMYELAAVEVSRNYRGCKLGEKILGMTMNDDFFDDKIRIFNKGFYLIDHIINKYNNRHIKISIVPLV
jgi:acetoin utilization protein AcuA